MSHALVAPGERPDASLIGRPAIDAPTTAVADKRPARDDARLHYLFRHALRAGQINPLLHLLPAYRCANAP